MLTYYHYVMGVQEGGAILNRLYQQESYELLRLKLFRYISSPQLHYFLGKVHPPYQQAIGQRQNTPRTTWHSSI